MKHSQAHTLLPETAPQSTPWHTAVPIRPKGWPLNSVDKKRLRSIRRNLYARQYIRREQNRARKAGRGYHKLPGDVQFRDPSAQARSKTTQNGPRSLGDHPETAPATPAATATSGQQANGGPHKAFEYHSLPHTDSIRLLILEPGEPPDKLVFRMETPRVTRTPRSYTAVSYVWGDDTSERIDISSSEGTTIPITQNLYDILCKLRLPYEPRRVWADAVCINQADVVERGHQVRQMGKIYSSAELVAVWLGRDDESCALQAFCAVSGLASRDQRQANDNGSGRRPVGRAPAPAHFFGPDKIYYRDSTEFSIEDPETCRAFLTLFSKPWFTRVWCIQEVALAKLAMVHWGDFQMSWEWLGLAAERYWDKYRLSVLQSNAEAGIFELAMELETGVANANYMYRVSHACGSAYSKPRRSLLPSFLRLLYESDGFKATDPRDRVYGLLGLPTWEPGGSRDGRPFMEPDYSLLPEQVYLRVARDIVRLYGPIPLLSCVQHGPEMQQNSLPTWVPRWDESYDSSVARPIDMNETLRSRACHQQTHTVGPGGTYIRVQGQKVSMVSLTPHFPSVAHLFGDVGSDQNNPRKMSDFLGDRRGQDMLSLTLRAGLSSCFELDDPHWEEIDRADFIAFVRAQEPTEVVSKLQDTKASQGDNGRFETAAKLACTGKKLVLDESGRLALVPKATRTGDWVCILEDGDVPFVLRPCRPYQDRFLLVGECYHYSYMGGPLGSVDTVRARAAFSKRTFKIH